MPAMIGLLRPRFVSFALLATASSLVLVPGCGSEDDKKKENGPKYGAGGDPSAAGSDAGSEGGRDGVSGSIGTAGESASEAGAPATGEAGAGSETGGAGGAQNTCPEGFGDCDDDPTSCETPLDTLVQCGGCDVSCSDSHGTPTCEDSKCVMTSCDAGYGDCDEDGTTGCELALAEDDAHCGACSRDCAAAGSECNTSM
jgi:hypothetical protein